MAKIEQLGRSPGAAEVRHPGMALWCFMSILGVHTDPCQRKILQVQSGAGAHSNRQMFREIALGVNEPSNWSEQ
jgi:hypothetical protein